MKPSCIQLQKVTIHDRDKNSHYSLSLVVYYVISVHSFLKKHIIISTIVQMWYKASYYSKLRYLLLTNESKYWTPHLNRLKQINTIYILLNCYLIAIHHRKYILTIQQYSNKICIITYNLNRKLIFAVCEILTLPCNICARKP